MVIPLRGIPVGIDAVDASGRCQMHSLPGGDGEMGEELVTDSSLEELALMRVMFISLTERRTALMAACKRRQRSAILPSISLCKIEISKPLFYKYMYAQK